MSALRSCIALLLLGSASFVYAYTSPGRPSSYVNDFAGVLNPAEKSSLETRLSSFAASTTNEISVVTIPNLGGDYIENYALKLFEEWGIGTQKNNNGVLLLLSVEDRQMRIEVGYGLEGALPDSVSDRIIRNEMVPSLQEGNYGQAIGRGVEAIIAATAGEYTAASEMSEVSADSIMPFLFFGFVVIQWLFAILARTKSWWLGGVVGVIIGAIASSFFGLWMSLGLGLTLGLTFLGLLLDFFISRAYRESVRTGSTPPWWTGGSGSWGGSNGGGGFGGFGGGRSGGGGASGRW